MKTHELAMVVASFLISRRIAFSFKTSNTTNSFYFEFKDTSKRTIRVSDHLQEEKDNSIQVNSWTDLLKVFSMFQGGF